MSHEDHPSKTGKTFIGKIVNEWDKGLDEEKLNHTDRFKIEPVHTPLSDRKRLVSKREKKEKLRYEKKLDSQNAQRKRTEYENFEKTDDPILKQTRLESSRKTDDSLYQIKKSSTRGKIFIYLGVFALLICAVVIFYPYHSFSKEKLISEFQNAVESDNIRKLEDVLVKPEKSDQDEFLNQVRAYLELLRSDKDYFSKTLNLLQNQQTDENSDIHFIQEGYQSFLKKGYRLKLLVKEYALPEDWQLVKESGKKWDQNKILLTAGIYKVPIKEHFVLESVTIDAKDLSLNSTLESLIKDRRIAMEPMAASNSGITLNIDGDPKAFVFINEKFTGKTVDEFNGLKWEIHEGDKIQLAEVLPWGLIISGPKEYHNSRYMSFEMNYVTESLKQTLVEVIRQTLKNDKEAFYKNDPSLLNTLVGEAKKQSENWIELNKKYDNVLIRKYEKFSADFGSLSVTRDDEKFKAYLGGFMTYRERSYFKGDLPSEVKDKDLKLFDQVRRGFHFEYDERSDQWKVNLWGTTFRSLDYDRAQDVNILN